jgi:hypothetical protein
VSRFFGDHNDFRKPGEPRPLVVTVDLLQELGVKSSPRAEQEQAVSECFVTTTRRRCLPRRSGLKASCPPNKQTRRAPCQTFVKRTAPNRPVLARTIGTRNRCRPAQTQIRPDAGGRRRRTHNPKVEGSNPAPATSKRAGQAPDSGPGPSAVQGDLLPVLLPDEAARIGTVGYQATRCGERGSDHPAEEGDSQRGAGVVRRPSGRAWRRPRRGLRRARLGRHAAGSGIR